jgi:hypothetical protein
MWQARLRKKGMRMCWVSNHALTKKSFCWIVEQPEMCEADSLTHLIPKDSCSINVYFLNEDKFYKIKRLFYRTELGLD